MFRDVCLLDLPDPDHLADNTIKTLPDELSIAVVVVEGLRQDARLVLLTLDSFAQQLAHPDLCIFLLILAPVQVVDKLLKLFYSLLGRLNFLLCDVGPKRDDLPLEEVFDLVAVLDLFLKVVVVDHVVVAASVQQR